MRARAGHWKARKGKKGKGEKGKGEEGKGEHESEREGGEWEVRKERKGEKGKGENGKSGRKERGRKKRGRKGGNGGKGKKANDACLFDYPPPFFSLPNTSSTLCWRTCTISSCRGRRRMVSSGSTCKDDHVCAWDGTMHWLLCGWKMTSERDFRGSVLRGEGSRPLCCSASITAPTAKSSPLALTSSSTTLWLNNAFTSSDIGLLLLFCCFVCCFWFVVLFCFLPFLAIECKMGICGH